MTKWLNSLQPVGALFMRLVVGAAMAVHGYQKVVPTGALHHHAHYVVTLGLPYRFGYVSAFTELIGGLFLIVGLLTRFAAALVAIDLLTAFVTVGIHQGFGIYSSILSLTSLAIMLLFYGAGAVALDRKIGFA